jgi:recombination protein RecR
LCSICASRRRDSAILCIAETPADVEAIEQASAYKGMYFILMGHLSPLDGIGPEQLGITRMLDLIRTETIDEVILATNLTLEGEATADYIADLLHEQSVSVTRLARGVPVGGELEYMDAGTLNQAFSDRRKI